MNINLLFTSVGRRVELLRGFRQAFKSLGIAGRIVALDIDPLAPALREADSIYIVPRLNHPEYIPQLQTILERENISAVFPLIDPDISLLAEHKTSLEITGARLAVVPLEAAGIVSDKKLTNIFFSDLGLPIAKSWMPEEIDSIDEKYPLFIKPRFGSSSDHVYPLRNKEELSFFSKYVPLPIIQECLTGPEITNDVVCDLNGQVLAVVSRQRIRVRGGEVIVGKTIHDQSIIDACVQIAAALPAIGPITVQCMMHQGSPKYTEINARFGGGMPVGIAAGADSLRWLVARIAGLPQDIPPLGSYQKELFFSRFDETAFLTEVEREKVASHIV